MLLFIDNIFRFTQAGSEVSALLGRMPSAVGYQPNLATEMGELQERITSTKKRFDHLGAGHLRAGRRLHRSRAGDDVLRTSTLRPCCRAQIAELGIYPAVDPLASTSRILDPRIVGEEHYEVAREVKQILQRYKDLQDIIAILGMDELQRRRQLTGEPRPQDPAVPVAAVLRGRAVHRTGRQVRQAGRHHCSFKEILEGSMTMFRSRRFTWRARLRMCTAAPPN